MELRKIKKRLTAAYNYSFIRMTLNFYTCYEMMAEKTGEPAEETLALYDRYLGSLGSFLEGFLEKKETFEKETLLEELEELRQDTIKEMEKLTAYTDIFQAYEYVMNRVEGRFMPQLVGKKPENTDAFMEEILNYLTQDSDPSGFHERFQLVVSQLPVRFTKNKFFALIQEGLSIYKGAPEAGLDDMIYVLRCEALLNRPKEGTESWKELYPFLEEFNQTDFKTLEAAEYYHLSSKLEEVSEKITDATGDILMLMDLVNDLYVLLLCGDHAVSDLKDTQVMVEIMSEVLKLFLDKQWKEIPVETADLLPRLEGKQETYFEQWIAGEEIPMDELAKSNLPECKVLWKTELLLSGSAFASLEYKASEAMADESMIIEKLDELFKEIRQSWKELPKVLTRAAMAKCLSRLPITFKTSDEAQAYIRNSLECCTDEIEKRGLCAYAALNHGINKISKMEQDLRGDFMRWWTHLYMGENASRNRVSILEGMRKGKMLVDTYVITLPESGNHILDILPVSLLTRQERDGKDFLVLGIARGYEEAAQLVRSMVDDMYQKTGAFNWKAYMESLPEKSGAEYGDWQEQ